MGIIPSKPEGPGYHLNEITKGEFGEPSKILEEAEELMDAWNQHCKVMSLVEVCDLIGAIKGFLYNYFPTISIRDLEVMADITQRAFLNGHRG